MFLIDEDMTIHVTRGDVVIFSVKAEENGKEYTFKAGDTLRINVFEKKSCENVVLQKDFQIEADTTSVDIVLTGKETRIGEVISKPTDYWYEVELNPETFPQTIIGYDDDGARVFKLYPEGQEIEEGNGGSFSSKLEDIEDRVEDLEGKVDNLGNTKGVTSEQANSLLAIIKKATFTEPLTDEERNALEKAWSNIESGGSDDNQENQGGNQGGNGDNTGDGGNDNTDEEEEIIIPDGVTFGEATTCLVASWLSGVPTTPQIVEIAESVEVVDKAVVLKAPVYEETFYTKSNADDNHYDNLKGKYVVSFAGDIYFIDPKSEYTHATSSTGMTSESIRYSIAYKVTAIGSDDNTGTEGGDNTEPEQGGTGNTPEEEGNGTQMGTATSCTVASWMKGVPATQVNVEFSDDVEVVDNEVALKSPVNTAIFYTSSVVNVEGKTNYYDSLLGKYVKLSTGKIYYIDPEANCTHNTVPTTYLSESISYNPAHEVTVKE